MVATAVSLNDLEGHSPVAGLFKCNPLNICAAFYTISTDSVLARFLCISRASCIPIHVSLFVIHKATHEHNALVIPQFFLMNFAQK